MSGQPGRKRLRDIFALPFILALLSLIGLVAALTGDGIRDVISWITLGIPLVVIVWAFKYRRR